jgi:SPP1 gp7 family putative phage head morphogenesis protein
LKKDYPLSPTGTVILQREFAIQIRRIFKNNIKKVYNYLKSNTTMHESMIIKNSLPNTAVSIINNALETMKFELSPIVQKFILAAWFKANKDTAKFLKLGEWINFDDRVAKSVQDYAYNFLNKFVTEQQTLLKDILIKSIQEGDRITTIADKIKNSFELSSYKSELIARSEVIRTYGISTKTAIINGGVTKKYQWKTSLKENVCHICKPLHNKIFDLNDSSAPMPVTNTHPQCNCGIIPYVEID